MSETATAPVYKQTTFSNMNLEVAPPAEPTVQADTPPAEPTTPQVPDTPAPETPAEQPAEAVVEENVSSFNLGFEGEQPKEEIKPEEAPIVYNWRDEIKKLDIREVAKELGLNDFALEINEYLKNGGKAADYLNAKAIDYNQISDEDLIKGNYRKEFPTFTADQINRLYDKKYGEKDIDSDDDKLDKELERQADAYKIRQAKISEQQKFVIPETPILQKDEAYEQWKQMQETQPAMVEQLKKFYQEHEATKNLNESKRVAINLGEGVAYNFSIDNPEVLTRMYTDGGETWQKVTSTKTGEPDVQKQQLIGLFSFDPMKYSQALFNYGMQMGRKKIVEEGQNAQLPERKVLPPEMNGQASYGVGKFGDKARN